MFGKTKFNKEPDILYTSTERDMKIVLDKSAEDLAESLEVMMIETRPEGPARGWLRGACCYLRDEQTSVSMEDAVKIVKALQAKWENHAIQARVLICQRVLNLLGGKVNART